MNRKLLALAVAAASALPLAASAAPTLYGRVDASLEYQKDDVTVNADCVNGCDSYWEVKNNASRLGFKGTESVAHGLTALYLVEWDIDIADNGGIKNRNTFVGLEGKFGQLAIGRMDTPLKQAQGMVDQFNDSTADMKQLVLVGEHRLNSSLNYTSPKLGDAITLKLAVQPGEQKKDGAEYDNVTDAKSLSIAYNASDLYVGLALDKDVLDGNFDTDAGSTGNHTSKDATRFVVTYKIDALSLGLLVQSSELADAPTTSKDDLSARLVSAAYALSEMQTVKLQYGTSTNDTGLADDTKYEALTLGYDHYLSKATKVYAFYNDLNKDWGTADADVKTFSVGVQMKF